MKNNTSQPKALLLRALNTLPKDFALKEANYYIKKAIYKIEDVEKKRIRREVDQVAAQTAQEGVNKMKESGVYDSHIAWQLTVGQAQKALDTVDKMIEQEKGKLKKLDDIDKQGNDVQTIFG